MSAPPADPSLLGDLRDGAWLDAQVFAPLAWALPGIFPEGLSLFCGPPKIGKSWFLLSLLLAISTGGKHLGIDVDQRPTLYLALEDGHRRMQARCRRLLGYEQLPTGFEYLTRCEPGRVLDTVTEWLERYAADEPRVAIDTLGKVMPPAFIGESSYQRDYRVGSALKRLVDDVPGAALVVAHHDRKAESTDFIESVSGTNGLAGASDTIVLLSRPRHETEGKLQVTGRDVPEGAYAVTYEDGCRWELVGGDLATSASTAEARQAVAGLSDRSAEVIAIVGRNPDGCTAAIVAEALDIDAKKAGTYLGRLAESQRIARASRGVYVPAPSDHVESVELWEPEGPESPHSNAFHTPTAEGNGKWGWMQ